jgi:hypothetical protein
MCRGRTGTTHALLPHITDQLDGTVSNAGLEELSVNDCAFMTHQAVAGIARCTSLTSLSFEEIYATRPNVRSSGVLSCMYQQYLCMLECAGYTRKAWLTWIACPLQRHIRHAQGTGSSSSMPVDYLRPFQTGEPPRHTSGPPAGAHSRQALSAAGEPVIRGLSALQRCGGISVTTAAVCTTTAEAPWLHALECHWYCNGGRSIRKPPDIKVLWL